MQFLSAGTVKGGLRWAWLKAHAATAGRIRACKPLKTIQIREKHKCDVDHLSEINFPPLSAVMGIHAPNEVVREGPAG
jgi:hypothetical protein